MSTDERWACTIEELAAEHHAPVRRMCARVVDSASADDLAQETFLRAVRSIGGYRGESPPMAWLATIARRVCADEIAARRRDRERHGHIAARVQLTHPDASAAVDLTDLLDRLPNDQREALVLTALVGLSYLEAAESMGTPVGTVRSRVSRARARLSNDLLGSARDGSATVLELVTPEGSDPSWVAAC